MTTKSNTTQIIEDIVVQAKQKKIAHLHTQGDSISGNMIQLNEMSVVNFSSCSYLGLEHDERLKQGAIKAIMNFGTQFSASRAYVSLGLYEELEALLSKMFGGHKVVVSATTTLGHVAAIPVLVNDGDAVILDHQVHHSVQTAAGLLKGKKVHMEMIRHNNMEMLEQKIKELSQKHNHIWYMADGVYSMFGDVCPTDKIEMLLNKYEQFHFYVDDAHGMSCFGENGSGYICSKMQLHKRMVLATSLNKAFASGGGAFVFADEEMGKLVRGCGSTMITSGPLQPANLGAAIAACNIHLSNEIYEMQNELKEKIKFTNQLLKNAELPLISESEGSVFFIGVSTPKLGYRLVQKMMERGFYLNLGIFPAVPIKNTGIRFTITRLHTYKQIADMIAALKDEFETALQEEGINLASIYKSFKMELPEEKKAAELVTSVINQTLKLSVGHYQTILDVNQDIWNGIFQSRGAFDWNNLALLESVFANNSLPEDNWEFDYITVKDTNGSIVAATFLTTALWKDDMLSPADISAKLEEIRKQDPYHFVSKITATGSLITEGEHVFVDQTSPYWKDATMAMLDKIDIIHREKQSSGVVLRDFLKVDEDLFASVTEQGYFKAAMPDAYVYSDFSWQNTEEFITTLNRKNRKNFKTDIKKFEDQFAWVQQTTATEDDIQRWYQLYLEVRGKNLDINSFAMPLKLFYAMIKNKQWDVYTLHHKANAEEMAVVFSYISGSTYVPTLIGMNYNYLQQYKIYKQSLYRILLRAKELGCTKINMGFGAGLEKRKLNCNGMSNYSLIHMNDLFSAEYLNHYSTNSVMK
jgi:7-keto-8-aminopelargonate synthetase-like enzyme/predicted N-acyltransferase